MEPELNDRQLRAGQLLAGRYRIEDLIGQGGMAEVYRGRDERLARPVALKVLRPRFAHDPELRQRFEEEAKAAAHVSSPQVVAVYDAGEDGSKSFIVMELVAGETLHEIISRGPLSSPAARSIGAQVLAALSAAHAKGVLHRDIKPANILITSEGAVKVADFGIAKAIHPSPGSEQHTMDVILGTPSYLAPERAQGLPATVASDLWSVGVLLYESLTGAKPFQGENAVAVSLAASQGRYLPLTELRPDLDPNLAAVVSRALSPVPADRFTSADEMERALGPAPPGAAAAVLLDDTAAASTATEPTTVNQGRSGGATPLLAPMGGAIAAPLVDEALAGEPVAESALDPARVGAVPAGHEGSRTGTAVLAGAALALVLSGLAVALLASPGGSHSKPASGRVGSAPTTTNPTEGPSQQPPDGRRCRDDHDDRTEGPSHPGQHHDDDHDETGGPSHDHDIDDIHHDIDDDHDDHHDDHHCSEGGGQKLVARRRTLRGRSSPKQLKWPTAPDDNYR